MANRPAAYKQPHIMEAIEQWWRDPSRQPFTSITSMYVAYTALALRNFEYGTIVAYDDFQRCIYKLGIRQLGDGDHQEFVQAPNWRPSDDLVMRFNLWVTDYEQS